MFTLKIVFIALLTGMAGETAPVGEITSLPATPFPTLEACKTAGDALALKMGPTMDAQLKASGVGIYFGAVVSCKANGPTV